MGLAVCVPVPSLACSLRSPRRGGSRELAEAGGTPVEIAARVLDVLVAFWLHARARPSHSERGRPPEILSIQRRNHGTDRGQEIGRATRQGRRRNTARTRLSRRSASHRADDRIRRRQAGSRGRSARSAGWAERPADQPTVGCRLWDPCRSRGQVGSREPIWCLSTRGGPSA